MKWFRKFFRDYRRISLYIMLCAAVAYSFNMWDIFLMMVAGTTFTASMVHITRKVLFPYFDMERFLEESSKSPISAAMVVVAMMLFTTIIGVAIVVKLL